MLTFFGIVELETFINQLSLTVTIVGSVLVVLLLAIALVLSKRQTKAAHKAKLPLFVAIVTVVLATTLTIGGGTVYLNIASATGGPVHWHADFEIWACGNELNLRDPHGLLSNKIGTPTLHEHNDKRIHVEGVPITLPYDFSLGKFMTVVGGGLSHDALTVPLNSDNYFETTQDGDGNPTPAPELLAPFIHTEAGGKVASFVSGQKCGDQPAEVQVFAMHYNDADKTYTQTKVGDPASYMPAKESQVPPGDCVIMEFAPSKARTDKLCKQYGIHDAAKCAQFGVPQADRHICDSHENTNNTDPCADLGPTQGISVECAKSRGAL
jgi:hypothetical protein